VHERLARRETAAVVQEQQRRTFACLEQLEFHTRDRKDLALQGPSSGYWPEG
jgi:hypothetical protein